MSLKTHIPAVNTHKVATIKEIRNIFGIGLKEAKDFSEKVYDGMTFEGIRSATNMWNDAFNLETLAELNRRVAQYGYVFSYNGENGPKVVDPNGEKTAAMHVQMRHLLNTALNLGEFDVAQNMLDTLRTKSIVVAVEYNNAPFA